jgi:hypothetical protein
MNSLIGPRGKKLSQKMSKKNKKDNPFEVWVIWNESFIHSNIIHIVTMLQKSWSLFACKGTKSKWKSCYDPSKSLHSSNGEQLQFILTFSLRRKLDNSSLVTSQVSI